MGCRQSGRYSVPSASSYGLPMMSSTDPMMPLAMNAATLSFCQGARSLRRTIAAFVLKRTGVGLGSSACMRCRATRADRLIGGDAMRCLHGARRSLHEGIHGGNAMELKPRQPTAKGPAGSFSGDVWIDQIPVARNRRACV